jgi:mycothiol synthase
VPALRLLEPATADDLAAIRALEARAAIADGHEALGAAAWRDLEGPAPGSFGVITADGSGARGYVHAAPVDTGARGRYQLAVVTDPVTPERPALLRALVEAATAEVARRRPPAGAVPGAGVAGGPRATLWVPAPDDATDAALMAAGGHVAREQLQMQVPLPVATPRHWPDGVELRSFRPGTDEAAWIAVNNRAFAGHAEQGDWTTETLARRLAEPGFDPDDVLLAWDEDGLAGFVWTKVHPASDRASRRGEIYVIGVDPDRQGTGLGRALVLAGLDHLARRRDCPVGLLYVAASNAAAIGLYRALGFTVTRTDRAYEWS